MESETEISLLESTQLLYVVRCFTILKIYLIFSGDGFYSCFMMDFKYIGKM